MTGCENCKQMQALVGRAEVRAADATAKLKRQQAWWGAWMLTTFIFAGFSAFLIYSFELKKWLWVDFIRPARAASQTAAPRASGQQLLPSTSAAPLRPQDNQAGRQEVRRRRRGRR